MIKANELRLGNLVRVRRSKNDEWRFCTVANLSGNTIQVKEFSVFEQIEHESFYEGIPLSPELMEACGFEKRDHEVLFLRINVLINSGLWYNGCDMYIHQFGSAGIIVPCEYVHQLQNLFWCLTGHELEIKLPVPLPHVPPSDIHP